MSDQDPVYCVLCGARIPDKYLGRGFSTCTADCRRFLERFRERVIKLLDAQLKQVGAVDYDATGPMPEVLNASGPGTCDFLERLLVRSLKLQAEQGRKARDVDLDNAGITRGQGRQGLQVLMGGDVVDLEVAGIVRGAFGTPASQSRDCLRHQYENRTGVFRAPPPEWKVGRRAKAGSPIDADDFGWMVFDILAAAFSAGQGQPHQR